MHVYLMYEVLYLETLGVVQRVRIHCLQLLYCVRIH